MVRKRRRVLDAGALLNSNFFGFDGALMPPSVVEEVKSRAEVLETLIASGNVVVKAPSKEAVEKVKGVAMKMGEAGALSEADVDALALALEEGATLITDDFHVQNVAEGTGIEYQQITERIREERRWLRRCSRCGKKYPQRSRRKICSLCGGRIVYSSN